MGVEVDEAGDNRLAGGVDDLRAVWNLDSVPWAGGTDAAVVDQDDRVGNGVSASAVDELGADDREVGGLYGLGTSTHKPQSTLKRRPTRAGPELEATARLRVIAAGRLPAGIVSQSAQERQRRGDTEPSGNRTSPERTTYSRRRSLSTVPPLIGPQRDGRDR